MLNCPIMIYLYIAYNLNYTLRSQISARGSVGESGFNHGGQSTVSLGFQHSPGVVLIRPHRVADGLKPCNSTSFSRRFYGLEPPSILGSARAWRVRRVVVIRLRRIRAVVLIVTNAIRVNVIQATCAAQIIRHKEDDCRADTAVVVRACHAAVTGAHTVECRGAVCNRHHPSRSILRAARCWPFQGSSLHRLHH